MRRIAILAAIVLTAAASQGTYADERGPATAAEVASSCEPFRTAVLAGDTATYEHSWHSEQCYGAFMAIHQLIGLRWAEQTAETPVLLICAPVTSRDIELIRVFLHYMDEHPQEGHEQFVSPMLSALQGAYPCKAKRSGKRS
jgi:Rap1a immunity proteins